MKDAVEFNGKLVTHKFMGDNDIIMDAWGRQKVIHDFSLFSSIFTYDIPDYMWKYAGCYSENNALVLPMNSSISSRQHMKYQPNRGQLFSTAGFLPIADGIIRFGLFTEENGCFFEVVNGEMFSVIRSFHNNTVIEDRKQITLPEGFDITKGHNYDIQFQWRGVGSYRFMIDLDEVISYVYTNTLTRLTISNPNLPVSFTNTSLDINCKASFGSVDVSTEGGKNPRLMYDSVINPVDKIVSNVGAPVLALRMKSTFKGQLNTIDYKILKGIFTTDKKTDFAVYFTEDLTALTGAVWVDDTEKAHLVDYSATTLTPSKCRLLSYRSYSVGGSYSIEGYLNMVEQNLSKGEILIIWAMGASANVRGSFDIGVEL